MERSIHPETLKTALANKHLIDVRRALTLHRLRGFAWTRLASGFWIGDATAGRLQFAASDARLLTASVREGLKRRDLKRALPPEGAKQTARPP